MGESRIHLTASDWSILSSLAFGGMLLYLFVVIYGTVGSQDRFINFDAPGVIEFQLDWSGTYIVYQEYDRTPDTKEIIRPATTKGLIARLQNVDSGEIIPVIPAPEGHEYKLQRILAEGAFQFDVPKGGKYRFATEFEQGMPESALRLVIIPTPAGRAMRVFLLGTAMALTIFSFVFGLAYAMNRRNRRRIEREVTG